jgi:ABC-type multidrug transport system fused ATPase/permease subunit
MKLSLWRLGLRWLRLNPLTAIGVIGLAVGQLVCILLIAMVFQSELAASLGANQIILRAAMMITLGLSSSAGLFLSRTASAHIANKAVRNLRIELLNLLYTRSYTYYARSNSGAIHATLVFDSERILKFFDIMLGQFLPAIVVGLGIGVALIWLNSTLVLILLLTAPFLLIFNRFSLQPLRRQAEKQVKSFKLFSQETLTALQLIPLTRMQTAENQEIKRLTKQIDSLKRETELFSRHQALRLASQEATLLIIVGLLLVIGGSQVDAGKTALGSLFAFNVILLALRRYFQDALASMPALMDGYHAIESLQKMISDAPPEPYSGIRCVSLPATISLRDVTYHYSDQNPILNKINLILAPHSVTALVGPNGSGKTTLVNLMLGLYRPQEGSLLINEHPYDEIDMDFLRRQVGILPQDPLLFDGTVWENITFGMPEATQEQVDAAVELASAMDIIKQLPDNYQTIIGEHGVRLSGGQRQRIALVRVLLRQPKFLILDEPTNHLDISATQQLIQNLVLRLHSSQDNPVYAPTMLIISHDMDLAYRADQIYTVSKGGLKISHPSNSSTGSRKPNE